MFEVFATFLLLAKAFIKEDSIKMFEEFNVYRREELLSRYNIKLEKYIKNITIEAKVMLEMAKQEISPQALKYANFLEETINKLNIDYYRENLEILIEKIKQLNNFIIELQTELALAEKSEKIEEKANYFSNKIKTKMEILRECIDKLEELLPKEYWPIPTYSDMLNS